ncbi:tyrosine-type recombinase/integrase [Jeotgalibaca porci]|uniref:tyrosine-type recombinase/integrase n=1 Tax=Jeotgalibaca porci TaxID=1868793 RepID=UPI00359FEEA7
MKGSVRKKGNAWYYRLDLAYKEGKRSQVERYGGKTKQEALDKMRSAIDEYQTAGSLVGNSNVSVYDYFEYWYDNYVVINLKLNTQLNYRGILDNHIYPYIKDYKLASIKTTTIQELLNKEFEKGYAKKTLDIVKGVLNKAFSMAVHPYEKIKINPTTHAKVPRYDTRDWRTREDLKIISMEDFRNLVSVVPKDDTFYMPMMIAFQTGLRRAEVCGLQWKDIDFDAKTLTVERIMISHQNSYVIGTPKSQSSFRTFEIGDSLIELLRKHRIRQSENRLFYGRHYFDSDFICVKENGKPTTPNSIKWSLRKFRDISGIDFNFHSFRHTYATMLLENGAKPKEIQHRLGHSRLSTTMDTYVHVTRKMQQESVNIFENLMKQSYM